MFADYDCFPSQCREPEIIRKINVRGFGIADGYCALGQGDRARQGLPTSRSVALTMTARIEFTSSDGRSETAH